MSRLLGRLLLHLLGFLHCFPLLLRRLPQHLSLRLSRRGLACIFFGIGALRFSRYRPCNDRGGQQHESGKSFHSVSRTADSAAVLISYADLTPKVHPGSTRGCYFSYSTSGWYRDRYSSRSSQPVERRASPPGWTLRLRSGQDRETPVTPPYDSSRDHGTSESSSSSATCNPSADIGRECRAS